MGTETQKTVLKLPSNSAETSKPASKWCNVNVKQTKKTPFFSPFCTSNTTTDFSKSSKSVLLLLLKTLFLFFSFFTQSAASFSCHPELAIAPYLLYIYISCLSVSIFRTKIQFYSVWERVRELAVFLFVWSSLLPTTTILLFSSSRYFKTHLFPLSFLFLLFTFQVLNLFLLDYVIVHSPARIYELYATGIWWDFSRLQNPKMGKKKKNLIITRTLLDFKNTTGILFANGF